MSKKALRASFAAMAAVALVTLAAGDLARGPVADTLTQANPMRAEQAAANQPRPIVLAQGRCYNGRCY
jgi:hypothetical protein